MADELVKPPKEIPYELVSKAEWGVHIASSFQYRAMFGTWLYFGSCPRCGHNTSTSVGRGMVMRMATVDPQPPPVTVPKLTVRCRCSHEHRQGETGCGAYASVFNIEFR